VASHIDQYTKPSPEGSAAGASGAGVSAAGAAVVAVEFPPPHAARETAIADVRTSAVTFFLIKNVLLFFMHIPAFIYVLIKVV
jgi:hypothetical protein